MSKNLHERFYNEVGERKIIVFLAEILQKAR